LIDCCPLIKDILRLFVWNNKPVKKIVISTPGTKGDYKKRCRKTTEETGELLGKTKKKREFNYWAGCCLPKADNSQWTNTPLMFQGSI